MDYTELELEKIEEQCLSICASAFRDYPFTHIETKTVFNENDPKGVLILKLHLEVQSGRDFNRPIQTYTVISCVVDHTEIFNIYGKFIRDGYSMDFTVEEILDLNCWCFEIDNDGWYNG